MAIVFGFPLLLLPFVLYNFFAFIVPVNWTNPILNLPMISGATVPLSLGDILVFLSVVALFGEVWKFTRITSRSIMDHGFALALFIVMLIEFLAVQKAGTATFFLMLMLSLFFDVMGGFIVTLRSAQREVTVESGASA